MDMFNISNLLNSIDNAAKETLEDPQITASAVLRRNRRSSNEPGNSSTASLSETEKSQASEEENEESSAGIGTPSSIGGGDSEVKKIAKKQKKEIERLSAEVLELEDQNKAIKAELQDVWNNYLAEKSKLADQEHFYLEEIKRIEQSNSLDKQLVKAQTTRVAEELNEAQRNVKALTAERDELKAQLAASLTSEERWRAREDELLVELSQARAGSVIGAQDLLESLANAERVTQQLRIEHNNILRQSQLRQAELERQLAEMSQSLSDKERELNKLNTTLSQLGRDNQTTRELESLRAHCESLQGNVNEERERAAAFERKWRESECVLRASQITANDDKERHREVVSALESKVAALEDKLKEIVSAHEQMSALNGGGNSLLAANALRRSLASLGIEGNNTSGSEGGNGGSSEEDRIVSTIRDLQEQVQSLTKQLLKKQGLVQELQAERSALKSRLLDLQNRCTKAEQMLLSLKDSEGGDDDDDDDEDFEGGEDSSNNSSRRSSNSILNRRNRAITGGSASLGGGSSGNGAAGAGAGRNHKVLTDLERIGVKAGPGVAKAVNLIDSYTMLTGRMLRIYPLLRLGFVIYLLVLHLWVFFVLAIHTHSLELDNSTSNNIIGGAVGAAGGIGGGNPASNIYKNVNNVITKNTSIQ